MCGAYDGTLHGWQTSSTPTLLALAFAFKPHESCVRALASFEKSAASAGSDQSIELYDLDKKRIVDRLSGVHEYDVTALAFVSEKFLVSGDSQGRLLVWKDRRVIHELKGHKQTSAVTSIAVHPSGRVALSTAKDNSLRLWNLVLAKAAPRTILGDFTTLSCACWSPGDGARYGVVGNDSTVLIFDSLSGSELPIGTMAHDKRVNSLKFVQDVVLASACEDGFVRLIGADGSVLRKLSTGNDEFGRPVRARDVASCSFFSEAIGEQTLVAGAFSDGTIRVWDVDVDDDEPITTLNVGTGAHVTCLAMTSWGQAVREAVHEAVTAPSLDQIKPMNEKVKANTQQEVSAEEGVAAPAKNLKAKASKAPVSAAKKKDVAPTFLEEEKVTAKRGNPAKKSASVKEAPKTTTTAGQPAMKKKKVTIA